MFVLLNIDKFRVNAYNKNSFKKGDLDIMNGKINSTWKKLFVWISAYLSYIAFALVGGYVFVKEEDEEVKKQAKLALFVTVIFACISAFLAIYSNCFGMSGTSYSSGAYEFYRWCTFFVNIGKILTYAVFTILAIVPKKDKQEKITEKKEEPQTEKVEG